MGYEFHEINGTQSINEIKKQARHILLDEIMEYLSTKYEDVKQVAENTYGVVVGSVPDSDGFAQDVCVTVTCICKPWYDKETGNRNVYKYDLEEEAEAYRLECEAKKVSKK